MNSRLWVFLPALLILSALPLAAQETIIVAQDGSAQAFACAGQDCERLAWLPEGVEVSVIAEVEGREIEGSALWYEVLLQCPCFDYERSNLQGLPPLQQEAGDGFYPWQPVFSPEGDRIAAVVDGHLYVWETPSGTRLVQTWLDDMHTGALAWSPDGTRIAVGGHTYQSLNRNLLLLDVNGWIVSALDGQAGYILDVAWSRDGMRIAAVGDELRIWDVRKESPLITVAVSARDVAWSPGDETLLLAGGKRTSDSAQGFLQIRDGSSGVLLNILETAGLVTDAAWSPHGTSVAWPGCGEDSCGLFVWDLVSENPSSPLMASIWPIDADWSPDGNFLVSNLHLSGQILDPEDGRVYATLLEAGEGLMPALVDWSPDGRRIVFSGLEDTWTAGFRERKTVRQTVRMHAAWVLDLTLIADGPTRAFIHSSHVGASAADER